MKSCFDCVIIGSGISGMTAAIYLKRANLNVLLLESSAPGGQMNQSSIIENYPGFTSITGPELSYQIFEQVTKLDVLNRYGNVISITMKNGLSLITTDMEEIETKNVIIATGRSPKRLELAGEANLIGKGLSWCAFCDGTLYRDKDVAVVGGGNSALEEALYLSNICKKVTIIHRRNEFRADSILQERVKNAKNIYIVYDAQITELKEENGRLSKLILSNSEELEVEGCFIYIGHTPNTSFLANIKIELDHDYIVVDPNMKTSVPGIYACGDVIKKDIYQLSTAVGEGTIAAMQVIKALD